MLRDELLLATPPSEPAVTNPNPLATTPVPPTAGVKLSLAPVSPRKILPRLYNLSAFGSSRSLFGTYSIKESEKESQTSQESGSDGVRPPVVADESSRAPAFGEENVLLSPATGKEGLKRRKPKNSIVKSNSSFISRVLPHEAMSKRIQEHNPEGLFAFANINRAFQWLDLSSTTFSKVPRLVQAVQLIAENIYQAEYIIKILFSKAHILCHDINTTTKGSNHLDVIMGSSSADIIWFEAFSQKYNRINKNVRSTGSVWNYPRLKTTRTQSMPRRYLTSVGFQARRIIS